VTWRLAFERSIRDSELWDRRVIDLITYSMRRREHIKYAIGLDPRWVDAQLQRRRRMRDDAAGPPQQRQRT
jgi:hypothetical protein